jgi:AcrR family transcriptional regulator
MPAKKTMRKAISPRKTPIQKRSSETVSVILEAAARVLEQRGFEHFNTNAIAEKAGVSIGSLYQYFPNKDALLSGLIAREVAPLLAVREKLSGISTCRDALRAYIQASMEHQMARPRLARLIDEAEGREAFQNQVSGTISLLQTVMLGILELPDAPGVPDRRIATIDVLTVIRGLIDAAGQREERDTRFSGSRRGCRLGIPARTAKQVSQRRGESDLLVTINATLGSDLAQRVRNRRFTH